MDAFTLIAKPWWVNLFVIAPFVAYFLWQKKLEITWRTLFLTGLFGIAFGFVEGAAVVYLREALGYAASMNYAPEIFYPSGMFSQKSAHLFEIEIMREVATLLMILSVSALAAKNWRERSAVFMWIFALWDIFYYITLKLTLNWPQALTTPDVLFLIPLPWISQVWYPILVSLLFILVVIVRIKKS